jgi:phosphatidylglycerol---prolipoprotein diacylglyceryl transferase
MPPRFYYSTFMLLALGVFLLTRRLLPQPAPLAALPWWQRAALALAGLIGGALGAKLPFVLGVSGDSTAWLADGKTITTGLATAYLAVELTKFVLGIHVKTGDTFALPLALALAVGRWGCFFNGCCYGVETTLPLGVDFGDGVYRHPTQIYESLFHLLLALLLGVLMLRDALRYQLLKLYLLAYCGYRFATEFIRPEPVTCFGLTFYQCVCVTLAAALTVQWVLDERVKAREAVLGAG